MKKNQGIPGLWHRQAALSSEKAHRFLHGACGSIPITEANEKKHKKCHIMQRTTPNEAAEIQHYLCVKKTALVAVASRKRYTEALKSAADAPRKVPNLIIQRRYPPYDDAMRWNINVHLATGRKTPIKT